MSLSVILELSREIKDLIKSLSSDDGKNTFTIDCITEKIEFIIKHIDNLEKIEEKELEISVEWLKKYGELNVEIGKTTDRKKIKELQNNFDYYTEKFCDEKKKIYTI